MILNQAKKYITSGALDKKLAELYGEDKILFATDCPWRDIKDDLDVFRSFNLEKRIVDKILCKNALKLLNL